MNAPIVPITKDRELREWLKAQAKEWGRYERGQPPVYPLIVREQR